MTPRSWVQIHLCHKLFSRIEINTGNFFTAEVNFLEASEATLWPRRSIWVRTPSMPDFEFEKNVDSKQIYPPNQKLQIWEKSNYSSQAKISAKSRLKSCWVTESNPHVPLGQLLLRHWVKSCWATDSSLLNYTTTSTVSRLYRADGMDGPQEMERK